MRGALLCLAVVTAVTASFTSVALRPLPTISRCRTALLSSASEPPEDLAGGKEAASEACREALARAGGRRAEWRERREAADLARVQAADAAELASARAVEAAECAMAVTEAEQFLCATQQATRNAEAVAMAAQEAAAAQQAAASAATEAEESALMALREAEAQLSGALGSMDMRGEGPLAGQEEIGEAKAELANALASTSMTHAAVRRVLINSSWCIAPSVIVPSAIAGGSSMPRCTPTIHLEKPSSPFFGGAPSPTLARIAQSITKTARPSHTAAAVY